MVSEYGRVAIHIEKYRPKVLDDVIGNFRAVQALKAFAKTGAFPQAIILHGPFGSGKTTAAKAVIRDYLVGRGIFAPPGPSFPGDAGGRQLMGIFNPVLFIQGGLVVSVEAVRDQVQKFMQTVPPTSGIKKFVVLDEGDKLSKEAQGALQTLIEARPNTVTIWTTNFLDSINGAIRSRASGGTFEFDVPEKQDLGIHLRKIAAKEGVKVPDDVIDRIVREAKSVRDAVGQLGTEVVIIRSQAPGFFPPAATELKEEIEEAKKVGIPAETITKALEKAGIDIQKQATEVRSESVLQEAVKKVEELIKAQEALRAQVEELKARPAAPPTPTIPQPLSPEEELLKTLSEYIRDRTMQEAMEDQKVFLSSLIDTRRTVEQNKRTIEAEIEEIKREKKQAEVIKPAPKKVPSADDFSIFMLKVRKLFLANFEGIDGELWDQLRKEPDFVVEMVKLFKEKKLPTLNSDVFLDAFDKFLKTEAESKQERKGLIWTEGAVERPRYRVLILEDPQGRQFNPPLISRVWDESQQFEVMQQWKLKGYKVTSDMLP